MKKIIASLLAVVLLAAMFVIPASALSWKDGQTQNEDGLYEFSNAYGYVFNVNSVNGVIGGEDATVITNNEKYAACNARWAITVVLDKVSDNVYSVNKVVVCPGADGGDWVATANVNLANDAIALVVHSAGSLPSDDKGTYPNWESKVAAMALKAGDKITLSGIDLAAGTVNNGTATVESKEDDSDASTDSSEESKETVIVSKNVALGKKYTGGDAANTTYTANLTDGVASNEATYSNVWFGLYYNSKATTPSVNAPDGVANIVIDLEEVYDLNSVKINFWNANTSGIGAPAAIAVSVSDDGENYSDPIAVDPAAGNDPAWTAKELADVSGRYVKVTITMSEGSTWCFLNEIEVYGDVEVEAGEEDNSSTSTPTPSTPVKPGDASNTIVFAILALVAIAGSAVVIKTRK